MYSPKIREDLIPEIYQLSQVKQKPMTVIVDELLRAALLIVKITQFPNNGGYHGSQQQLNLVGASHQS